MPAPVGSNYPVIQEVLAHLQFKNGSGLYGLGTATEQDQAIPLSQLEEMRASLEQLVMAETETRAQDDQDLIQMILAIAPGLTQADVELIVNAVIDAKRLNDFVADDHVSVGGFKLTDVGDATSSNDAVNLGQVLDLIDGQAPTNRAVAALFSGSLASLNQVDGLVDGVQITSSSGSNIDLLTSGVLLIDSDQDGIYYRNPSGDFERHPEWMDATEYDDNVGMTVFVDQGSPENANTTYRLVAVSTDNGNGTFDTTFEISGRSGDLVTSGALNKSGNNLSLQTNSRFTQTGGVLQLSGAVESTLAEVDAHATRLTAVETVNTQQSATLVSHGDTLSGIGLTLTNIATVNAAQDTAIAALGTANAAQDTAIADIQGINGQQNAQLASIISSNTSQDAAIAALQTSDAAQTTTIAQHESAIEALEQADITQAAQIVVVEAANAAQDTAIFALQTSDTAQTAAIGQQAAALAQAQTALQAATVLIQQLEARTATKVITVVNGVASDPTIVVSTQTQGNTKQFLVQHGLTFTDRPVECIVEVLSGNQHLKVIAATQNLSDTEVVFVVPTTGSFRVTFK